MVQPNRRSLPGSLCVWRPTSARPASTYRSPPTAGRIRRSPPGLTYVCACGLPPSLHQHCPHGHWRLPYSRAAGRRTSASGHRSRQSAFLAPYRRAWVELPLTRGTERTGVCEHLEPDGQCIGLRRRRCEFLTVSSWQQVCVLLTSGRGRAPARLDRHR